MEPRIAVYLRVSTDSQNHDSQRSELEDYCCRRGWKNARWFADVGSGTKQDRAGLKQLMELVRRGKVDVLVAYKLDRLARSLSHLANVLEELRIHGTALVCPSQGIDTSNSNPAAQLQINILAAVACFERELITERVNAGLKAAKQRGVRLGRPNKMEQHTERIRALIAEGRTTGEIGHLLKIPYSTLAEAVREIKAAAACSSAPKCF